MISNTRDFSHKEHKEHREFLRKNFNNTRGRIFDIMREYMNSLSLQIALLRRLAYAGDGMGAGFFCETASIIQEPTRGNLP